MALETRLKDTSAGGGVTPASGLSNPVTIPTGGTGETSAQNAINALTQVAAASAEQVLTKDTGTGNATFKNASGGNFTASGSVVYLTATSNFLAVGRTSQIGTEKVVVDGSTDIIQTIIRAFSTQTVNIFEVRKSDNTVNFAVTNTGGIVVGGTGVTIGSNSANVSLSMSSAFVEKVVTLSDVFAPALDASLGNIFYLSSTTNATIAVPTNATSGQKIIIRHLASGAARTLSLNTGSLGFRYGTDITALTSTSSGKMDYIGAIYNAVGSSWDVCAYSRGF